jgi:hypothetical protein
MGGRPALIDVIANAAGIPLCPKKNDRLK